MLCVLAVGLSSAQAATPKNKETLDTSKTPLHQRIDALIVAADPKFDSFAAAQSSNAEFFRRVHLDLVGAIPSVEEVRTFLDENNGSNQRTAVIDRLLGSPRYARRMQYLFDLMLMEGRTGNNVPTEQWQNYLRQSFLDNKPWNQLVLEILTADGVDPKMRPAAKFYLDRNFDVDLVTRDIGRIFLGKDLECAQCHDHPSIDDYLQRHYYGISAFLKRSYVFREPKTKAMMLGEKAEGEATFTSVFTAESGTSNPRILDLLEIADPKWAAKAYIAAPKGNVRGIASYSRRQQLGWAMTDPENMAFCRNIVNRLWAIMMGRGLVEPLNISHSDNLPSHPELLDLLANEFREHQFDIQWLLREMAVSKTYQRSSELPAGANVRAAKKYAVGLLKPMSSEQLAWSMMEATDVTERTMAGLEARLLKSDPKFGAGRKTHPLWREEALHTALKGSVAQFVQKFSAQGGQKTGFESSADQALFFSNGALLQSWLVPQSNNLTDRLRKLENSSEFTEELYLSVLSRSPTEEETQEVVSYLKSTDDRESAVGELAWALLVSAEFRLNH